MALENGHALIDEDGEVITIDHPKDDIGASRDINEHFTAPAIQSRFLELCRCRNDLPLVEKAAPLSHPYANNLYHSCPDIAVNLDLRCHGQIREDFDSSADMIPDCTKLRTLMHGLA